MKTRKVTAISTGDQPSTTSDDIPAVRILDADECWDLLTETGLGRFAVRAGDGVDIFPVNYLIRDHELYFRSAPGSKLVDLTREPSVAFEVDGEHAQHVWSVVVHGTAHRLGTEQEISLSGISSLETSYPSEKFNYVRITPRAITGRTFAKSAPA